MSKWFGKVINSTDLYSTILDVVDYFSDELTHAKKEVQLSGIVEQHSAALPGIVEHRFSQLQEIEAILEHLNIKYRKTKHIAFKKYFEQYGKQLTSRDAERYAEAEDEVLLLSELINHIAYIRNQYTAIHKALDVKSWQIQNVVKLRTAGLEDVVVRPIGIRNV